MTDDDVLGPYEWMIQDAVKKAAASKEPEKILATLLSQLPGHLRAAIEQRFRERLVKASGAASTPVPQKIDYTPRRFSMAQALALITNAALEKIKTLLRNKPGIEAELRRAGENLVRHGVTPDAIVSESSLGEIAPVAGIEQAPTKGPVRG